MEIEENWGEIKELFRESFRSSFHYAIATVSDDGKPHVTPIGSLILGRPGFGFYFEEFSKNLPRHLGSKAHVCVLAVNSSRWFWVRSLSNGRFRTPPAIRMRGKATELRLATEREKALWLNRVKRARFSKGHAIMWRGMNMVRDIEFSSIEPVNIGEMTRDLW